MKPMMILIAGPYRSGTNDDPEKIAANVHFMESFAVPIFRKGHIPVLGEWYALPLLALAGSKKPATRSSTRYSIPLRCVCSINATPFCAWAAHRQAQT
jgi:hypothetical protein